jgi:hypothetical protein
MCLKLTQTKPLTLKQVLMLRVTVVFMRNNTQPVPELEVQNNCTQMLTGVGSETVGL